MAKDNAENQKPGFLASLAQAAMAATGKLMGDIARDVVADPEQVEQGAHEAAAVLFRGDAFVMYPRTSHGNDQEQGGTLTLDQMRGMADTKAAEHQHEQTRERGGHEM